MKWTDKQTVLTKLQDRLSDITNRERIVLDMPFDCDIKRVEFYCSDSYLDQSGYFGKKFPGIVTISAFNDYSNKPAKKTSYTYKNELFDFLPRLVDNLEKTLKPVN